MIESQARVVTVEPDHVWVEAERRSACGHCSDSAGCGMAAVGELFGTRTLQLRLPGAPDVQPGDIVTIGLPERQLLTVALSAYLLPLLVMFGAVLPARLLDLGQGVQVAAGLAGLAAGLWLAGRRAGARQAGGRDQPVILGPYCRTSPQLFHQHPLPSGKGWDEGIQPGQPSDFISPHPDLLPEGAGTQSTNHKPQTTNHRSQP